MKLLSTSSCVLNLTQFAALLGDLQHRFDVHTHLADFGPAVVPLFSNSVQAQWLCQHTPEHCPSGENNHSLGTHFEFQYYSNLTFTLLYLSWLDDVYRPNHRRRCSDKSHLGPL